VNQPPFAGMIQQSPRMTEDAVEPPTNDACRTSSPPGKPIECPGYPEICNLNAASEEAQPSMPETCWSGAWQQWWPSDSGESTSTCGGHSLMPPRDGWAQNEYFWSSMQPFPVIPLLPHDFSAGYFQEPRRRRWICSQVEEVLDNPPPEVTDFMESDGSVSMSQIFAARPDFENRMFYNPSVPIRAMAAVRLGRLAVDVSRQTVRLKSLAEQLREGCEECMRQRVLCEPMPLDECLACPPVQQALANEPASLSFAWEDKAALSLLWDEALAPSRLLKLVTLSSGVRAISQQQPSEILRFAVESLLDAEPKARILFSREGEVALHWIRQRSEIKELLEQIHIQPGKATFEALQAAVMTSTKYTLDKARMSVCMVDVMSQGGPLKNLPLTEKGKFKNARCFPAEKDVRQLRELLNFYFAPFTLQHNRVLISMVGEQRKSNSSSNGHTGYLRSSGHRPVFQLKDLFLLPRIGRLFEQYEPFAHPWLLSAALQAHEMPVRLWTKLAPGAPRGAWAADQPAMQLTYVPNLRFIEAAGPCKELEPLLCPAEDPAIGLPTMPSHAVCVLSYSVSSDLSNPQSPKAKALNDDILTSTLSHATLQWEVRQKQIRRQLMMYDADLICIQGLQSVGFAERSSEMEPGWFAFEAEPAANHLVHLYRSVSTENYGVVFAPTLKLPGSDVTCFGNAIFWKRSRWQLERQWSSQRSSISAELLSRTGSWRILVCSTKPAASYAREWGDVKVADSDMTENLKGVHTEFAKTAAESDVRCVWCGDFGTEPRILLRDLASDDAPDAAKIGWRTASAALLNDDPWTTVASQNHGKATDAILYGDGLDVLGVLGGLPNLVNHADFLSSGYPSDHLLQLAVLANETDQVKGSPASKHQSSNAACCSSSGSNSMGNQGYGGSGASAATADVMQGRKNHGDSVVVDASRNGVRGVSVDGESTGIGKGGASHKFQ